MTRLIPSFLRVGAFVLFWFIVLTVIGYFWQGYRDNHWWSANYVLSLCIPLVLMTVSIWFGFVPRRLEYNEQEITIHSWWMGRHTFKWDDLKYYGSGYNVFLLQFGTKQAFQILTQAYPKREWNGFRMFLNKRYPGKKATGWIGPFGFKWKK